MITAAGLLANGAWAQDWQPMSPDDLVGLNLDYGNAQQSFDASGKTTYVDGRPSLGNWQNQGSQYCSQWPPSDLWACYVLERAGEQVRFTATSDGSETVGTIQ
jgi:hypothetical protein